MTLWYNFMGENNFINFQIGQQFIAQESCKMHGTSLMLQWLTFHAPNSGGQVQYQVRELDSICYKED